MRPSLARRGDRTDGGSLNVTFEYVPKAGRAGSAGTEPCGSDSRSIDLLAIAQRARMRVLDMCAGRGQGYAGQGLALADVLAHLYFRVMRRRPDGTYLDRFVLSTGHSAIALFAILGEVGIVRTGRAQHLRPARLPDRGKPAGRHARLRDHRRVARPGPVPGSGDGVRRTAARDGARVYCLLSDGELEEGQVWEAAMSASHFRLDNLTVLIDNNHIQADGATAEVMGVEPVVERFSAFGFEAQRVDGHDHAELVKALPSDPPPGDRPRAVVLETVPGKGVPTFEKNHKVHYLRLGASAWTEAIAELGPIEGDPLHLLERP